MKWHQDSTLLRACSLFRSKFKFLLHNSVTCSHFSIPSHQCQTISALQSAKHFADVYANQEGREASTRLPVASKKLKLTLVLSWLKWKICINFNFLEFLRGKNQGVSTSRWKTPGTLQQTFTRRIISWSFCLSLLEILNRSIYPFLWLSLGSNFMPNLVFLCSEKGLKGDQKEKNYGT